MFDLNRMRELDVDELVVRVSQYAPDARTATSYQAIAKLRGKPGGPWGVGIRSNPEAAVNAALDEIAQRTRIGATVTVSRYGF